MNGILEKLYERLPVRGQDLAVSAYGLLWKHQRLGGDFGRYVQEFRNREHLPPKEFYQDLGIRLRAMIHHARSKVPYYSRAWAGVGLTEEQWQNFKPEDLPRLPITPKSLLRERPKDFVACNAAANGRLYSHLSSGTTGTPITAICTADDHRKFMAAREARSFAWAGTSMLKPRSMIGGRLVVPKAETAPPFHRYNHVERQVYFSAYHISPHTAPYYVAALNRHRPGVFTGYAYSHYLLARMMLERGLRLDYTPEAMVLGSERLTPEMKEIIGQAFGARAYEEYGCVENCVLATECEEGRLHVSPDFGIVEIVDERGRSMPPGVEGRILGTSLLNWTQPLIRYDLGDLGVWSDEPCPCGRNHLPVLKEIVGRLEDVVTGPDGRQMVRFHGIFVGLPNVVEGQVIQESLDRFTVNVVAHPDFGPKEEQTIRERFIQRLGNVQVRIVQVPEIPRTRRGKFRAVISRINDPRPCPAVAGLP